MMKIDFGLNTIGKQIKNISNVYKLVIIIGLNVAIFASAFVFVISPQSEERRRLAGQYETVKKDLDRMLQIKNNMPKYREEYARLQETLDDMIRQLPEGRDVPNLLRSVSAVGSESKVKVTYFEPGPVQAKEFYGEFPLKIKYNGPFHNIGYFFDGIRKTERIIEIVDFSLVAKGPPNKIILEGECTARSYVYLKEPPKPKKEEGKDGRNAKGKTK